jgi:hypothetical protein
MMAMDVLVETDLQDLIFRTALVVGMGAQARPIAAEAVSGSSDIPEYGQGKTCIDAGGQLLLSLHSACPGELGIIRRISAQGEGIQHWLRSHYRRTPDGFEADRWHSAILTGESAAGFDYVVRCVRDSGEEARFRHVQARLGRFGRLRFAMKPVTPGRLPAWIGWQLDRYVSPATALDAIGEGTVWPEARSRMEAFLGMRLTDRSRPWSIAVEFGTGERTVRVGSTIWSRQPEDRAKRRRFVEQIEAIGGDGEGFEALYRLLLPDVPGPLTRVGRALEIEFRDGRFVGVSALLRADVP